VIRLKLLQRLNHTNKELNFCKKTFLKDSSNEEKSAFCVFYWKIRLANCENETSQ